VVVPSLEEVERPPPAPDPYSAPTNALPEQQDYPDNLDHDGTPSPPAEPPPDVLEEDVPENVHVAKMWVNNVRQATTPNMPSTSAPTASIRETELPQY